MLTEPLVVPVALSNFFTFKSLILEKFRNYVRKYFSALRIVLQANFFYFFNKVNTTYSSINLLDDPEHIETWIRTFATFTRMKKSRDTKTNRGVNKITDLFLATAGCETVKEISTMCYLSKLEKITFEEIIKIINKNI